MKNIAKYLAGLSPLGKMIVAPVMAVVMLVVLSSGLVVSTMLPTGQPTQQPAQMSNVSVTQMRVVTKAHTVPMAPTPGGYTVKEGDTLGKIAMAHGTSVAALASANGIENVHLIRAGDVLKIGNAPSALSASQVQSASAHSSSAAQRALALAKQIDREGRIGYHYGSDGPNTYDCSSFTQFVFGQQGVDLPRTSKGQSQLSGGQFIKVSRGDIRPGDLVFFYSPVSHVGIAVDNDRVVHASTDSNPLPDQIKISDIDAMEFNGAIRVVG